MSITEEKELTVPILKLLSESSTGFMKTSDIIKHLVDSFNPTGPDAEILMNRSDIRFTQIVRNIISHRETSTNPINNGLLEYDYNNKGLRITAAGRAAVGR